MTDNIFVSTVRKLYDSPSHIFYFILRPDFIQSQYLLINLNVMQFLSQHFLFAKVQLNPWVNIEYLHLRQKSNNTVNALEIPGIVYCEVG